MVKRTMDEMITYFNDTVSTMDISINDKMTLLGMITAIGYEYQKAEYAIEELQLQKPKWILVTERLPDVHKNVLCCGSKGGQFVGWVSNHVSDGKALAFVHGGYGRLITHWMPLPEPPKEETDVLL